MLSKRVQRIVKLREKSKKAKKHNNKEPICYNCGKSGHFKADCFKKKKDEKLKEKEAVKEKRKTYKKGKRVMMAGWSDDYASSGKSFAAEEVGLMADFEVTLSLISSHSSTEFRNSDEEKIFHEELVEALFDVCIKLKTVTQEKRSLQKSLETALFEKENLQQDLSKSISDRKTLEEKMKSAPQTNQ